MPDLHADLTREFQTALEAMFDVPVGHSVTGDVRHLHDDARTLADVAEKVMGDVWEHGRKHGIRQARRPHNARVKQLEEEIESMLITQEANSQAFLNRCERVRELEDVLAHATQFGFPNGVTVTRSPWGDGWRIAWPDPDAPGDPSRFHPLTEDRDDREEALARARELAAE